MSYYIITFQDVINDTVEIIDVLEDYDQAMVQYHNSYKSHLDDPSFIIRPISEYITVIYKRVPGTIWSSKYCAYKIQLTLFKKNKN